MVNLNPHSICFGFLALDVALLVIVIILIIRVRPGASKTRGFDEILAMKPVPLMRVEFQAPGDHRSRLLGKIRRLVEAGLSGERKESTLDLEGPKVHEDQGPEPAQPAPVIPPAGHAPSSGGSPPREGAPLEDLL